MYTLHSYQTMLVPGVLVLALIAGCQSQPSETTSEAADTVLTEPTTVSLILDTDIGPDYDDVGAMALLHALEDQGEAKILAVVSSNLSPLVVPTIDVLNTYFGHPDIPIGAPKTAGVELPARQHWSDTLVAKYAHDTKSASEAPDAVQVYRQVLSAQPDSSVTIVTVGFLTNMRNLMESKPDERSPLSGRELVAQKVKQWVAMAGKFPEGVEFNVEKDSTASQVAIDEWPTPVLFSGFEIGEKVLTGLRLIEEGNPESPVQKVYAISIPMDENDKNGRMSWDQTAVLVAVRGAEPYYEVERGKFITRADGSNAWQDDPSGPHRKLVEKMPPEEVAAEIETLMMHEPQQ